MTRFSCMRRCAPPKPTSCASQLFWSRRRRPCRTPCRQTHPSLSAQPLLLFFVPGRSCITWELPAATAGCLSCPCLGLQENNISHLDFCCHWLMTSCGSPLECGSAVGFAQEWGCPTGHLGSTARAACHSAAGQCRTGAGGG